MCIGRNRHTLINFTLCNLGIDIDNSPDPSIRKALYMGNVSTNTVTHKDNYAGIKSFRKIP